MYPFPENETIRIIKINHKITSFSIRITLISLFLCHTLSGNFSAFCHIHWPLVSEQSLLQTSGQSCFCLFSCGFYYNYTERTLVTVSERKRICWRDQQSERGQCSQILGHNHRRLPNTSLCPI